MGLEVELRIVNKAGVEDKIEIEERACIYNSELRKGIFTSNVRTLPEDVVEANTTSTVVLRKNYLARDLVEIITRTRAVQCSNVVFDAAQVLSTLREVLAALEVEDSVYNSELLNYNEAVELVKEVSIFLYNFDPEANILVHSFL